MSRGHPSRSTFDRRTGQGRLETNRLEGSLSNDQCRTSHHRAKPRPTWLAETHNYGRASNSPWVRLSVGPGPRMALKAGVCRQGSRQLCDSASCPCGSLQATAGTGAGLSALGLAPSVEADHQWRRIPVPTPEPPDPCPDLLGECSYRRPVLVKTRTESGMKMARAMIPHEPAQRRCVRRSTLKALGGWPGPRRPP